MQGAQAFTFQIDTTYDGGYFTAHPDALTALNKAASDLSAVLKPSLNAVPSDFYQGSAGSPPPTTVSIDWDLTFQNPSNPSQTITINTFNFGADVFEVYVGARPLSGSELGQGSAVGLELGVENSDYFPDELVTAAAQAEMRSNSGMRGTKGPLFGEISTTVGSGADEVDLDLKVGAIGGVVAFSTTANWHFDINTPPMGAKVDFYSVALHELIHTLGFGTSQTWDDQVTGTNWNGPAVGALTNGGTGVISPDGGHVSEGRTSPVLVNASGTFTTGLPQEAAMDPSLTNGVRKNLTQLDLAFMKDLGFDVVTVAAVPERAARRARRASMNDLTHSARKTRQIAPIASFIQSASGISAEAESSAGSFGSYMPRPAPAPTRPSSAATCMTCMRAPGAASPTAPQKIRSAPNPAGMRAV